MQASQDHDPSHGCRSRARRLEPGIGSRMPAVLGGADVILHRFRDSRFNTCVLGGPRSEFTACTSDPAATARSQSVTVPKLARISTGARTCSPCITARRSRQSRRRTDGASRHIPTMKEPREAARRAWNEGPEVRLRVRRHPRPIRNHRLAGFRERPGNIQGPPKPPTQGFGGAVAEAWESPASALHGDSKVIGPFRPVR